MSVMTVDTAELATALAAAVAQILEAHQAVPRLYDAEQVSDLTGKAVKPSWLEQAAREGRIPVRRVGRSLRWAVEDIVAAYACWLEEPRNATKH